jgi:RNA polymerase sigma factor (TIGR02999 family)
MRLQGRTVLQSRRFGMTHAEHEITVLLQQWEGGDQAAFERLLPLIYRELRRIARHHMRGQHGQNTLQTTALINEAYLKLGGGAESNWASRAHFFGVAAKAMRHVLVDRARSRRAARRGGEMAAVTLDEGMVAGEIRPAELIALDDALVELTNTHPRQAQVVELRWFGGLSVEETAGVLNVSAETVARDWRFARAYLQREVTRGAG